MKIQDLCSTQANKPLALHITKTKTRPKDPLHRSTKDQQLTLPTTEMIQTQ